MLAATPDRNSVIALIQLILTAVDKNSKIDISDPLKNHLIKVLSNASAIAENPELINKDTPEESLILALRIRENKDLVKQISAINSFDNINAVTAKNLLKSL